MPSKKLGAKNKSGAATRGPDKSDRRLAKTGNMKYEIAWRTRMLTPPHNMIA
ncbi:hypothetical protein GWO43_28950 [candidate division KSB1 bacterium]|nr:hypothetical protein [candidate division KSB1 bacterium]NIV68905.1 hypothetical protein [Phycisphaerae bacterium]NIS27936.1 hypothetical protein [candidate division KSB1 bacterium]NIT74817.1 hypothetical protein [candidate division KSB1 bacterium]NIU28595.1 hypothetical protein [candidate division KSB1 bacterium]